MSFGERGESQFAWKEKGATLEIGQGRPARTKRSARAALLGAEIEFFDCGDYPLKLTEAHFDRMVRHLSRAQSELRADARAGRSLQFRPSRTPRISPRKPGWSRRRWATSPARNTNYAAPPVFLFEPHQPEQCNYKPTCSSRSTRSGRSKYEAFQILAAQKHLWGYYDARRAQSRHAGRPQHRRADDLWRGLSAPVPDGGAEELA